MLPRTNIGSKKIQATLPIYAHKKNRPAKVGLWCGWVGLTVTNHPTHFLPHNEQCNLKDLLDPRRKSTHQTQSLKCSV
jgi:hypothetical protein